MLLQILCAFAIFVASSTATEGGRNTKARFERIENILNEKLNQIDVLQKKLGSVEHELSVLKKNTNATMYAFSVRLHEDTETNDNPVIFGTVDLNIGDGYDEFVGGFTAPEPGVYLLTVYAMTASVDAGPIYIKTNADILCTAQITAGNAGEDVMGADTGTCTTITELTPEDTVRVTGNDGDPAIIAAGYSGFSGHLI